MLFVDTKKNGPEFTYREKIVVPNGYNPQNYLTHIKKEFDKSFKSAGYKVDFQNDDSQYVILVTVVKTNQAAFTDMETLQVELFFEGNTTRPEIERGYSM